MKQMEENFYKILLWSTWTFHLYIVLHYTYLTNFISLSINYAICGMLIHEHNITIYGIMMYVAD
jgi:hypothetical protein